jgi:hypothetical protein
MGLDMYLRAERYLTNYDYSDEAKEQKELGEKIAGMLGAIPGGTVSGVTLRVGYWRKANQIHKWFVDNVQGGEDECNPHYVSVKQLKELHDLCVKILSKKGTKGVYGLIEEFLPPQSGFFFGSSEVDEYYFSDLQSTVDQLKPLIEFNDEHHVWSYQYQSSW